jgi:hypothetical protein
MFLPVICANWSYDAGAVRVKAIAKTELRVSIPRFRAASPVTALSPGTTLPTRVPAGLPSCWLPLQCVGTELEAIELIDSGTKGTAKNRTDAGIISSCRQSNKTRSR